MTIRLWTLIFLSPFILYAIYLILDEGRDPFTGFHEEFRSKYLGVENVEPAAGRIASGTLKGVKERDLSIAVGSSIIVFFIALGVSIALVGIMSISGYSYFLWKQNESSRMSSKDVINQEAEFPAIVELLAILIAAGESPSSALVHVADRAHGSLGESLEVIATTLRSGMGLIASLEAAAKRSGSGNFKRFCDSLIVAVERGTPLVSVLQSQVLEARSAESHRLIKSSGKAEIALMIPIVFLILPISILFALWPSYVTLGTSIHG